MHKTAAVAVLAGLVWAMLASPLGHPFPETVDWPGHQVRHALAGTLPGDPVLDELYRVQWRAIPNLAGDVLMLGLEPLLGASLGSRLLLAVGMAGWVAAPLVLSRVLWGRLTAWPLVASLFVYNALLYMGFENHYLTAPLAMLLLALWVHTEDRHPEPLRLAGLAVGALVVWFGHLVVWGCFAIWVGGVELARDGDLRVRIGHIARAAVAFLPGLGLFVWQQLHAPATHGGGTVWSAGWGQKLGLVLSPVLQYDPAVDLGTLLVVLPFVAIAGLLVGQPQVHPRMRIALALFAVATLVIPGRLLGVGFMDQRLPPMLLGLLVACVDVRLPTRIAGAVAGVVALALVARTANTHVRWSRHSAEVAEVMDAAERLEPGARVLAAGTSRLPHYHTSAFLVPRARVFVPNLFTGAHLLTVTPALARLDHPSPAPPSRALLESAHAAVGPFDPESDPGPDRYLRRWWTDFDALLWLSSEPPPEVGDLVTLHEGLWFTLYRLPPEAP